MNVCSLRQRLYYHGREIVLGGDAYAHVWETVNLTPCDILKVPHHGSLASTSRKLLEHLRPKTAVVTVAARRPDERPHPYIVSLLREYAEEVYFTDAVEIPGLVEPEFHTTFIRFSRLYTRRGFRISSSMRSYSLAVRSTGCPSRMAIRSCVSSVSFPTVKSPP